VETVKILCLEILTYKCKKIGSFQSLIFDNSMYFVYIGITYLISCICTTVLTVMLTLDTNVHVVLLAPQLWRNAQQPDTENKAVAYTGKDACSSPQAQFV